MVPRKLVETVFSRVWVLLAPVVLIPVAVVLLQDRTPVYRSSAVVWVGRSPAGNEALGHYNPYLSPAQNQANSLNDLLSTDSFRKEVLGKSSLQPDGAVAAGDPLRFKVFSFAHGANLLTIVGEARTGEAAQALVAATVEQFLERGTEQTAREASFSAEYYRQQLIPAEAELTTRRKAIDDYLRANPSAANPGSPANMGLDYQTLVKRAEDQGRIVLNLQNSLQQVQLDLAAAPQSQESAFEVQDPAAVPSGPVPASSMSRFGLPFAGLVLGALVSSTYLYLVYRTDHTIRSVEDLEGLDVEVLGRVPQIDFRRGLGRVRGLGWIARARHRDFARRTASAISSDYWLERGA